MDALLFQEADAAGWPDVPLPRALTNDPLGMELLENVRRDLKTALEALTDGVPLAKFELRGPCLANPTL